MPGMHESEAPGEPLPHVQAFGVSRNYFNNRFVYLVVSQRARGLSIGVNLNPDKHCNFKCAYCEIDCSTPARDWVVDLQVMAAELENFLGLVRENRIAELPGFGHLPPDLLQLKEVALSGDGEPTLCPQFADVIEEVVRTRARGLLPFFKIVLITNTAGLPRAEVRKAVKSLNSRDEIWVKLDAGTQAYMNKVNVPDITLDNVMSNILSMARERPVVIQSLFPLIRGQEAPPEEIEQYVQRLKELKAGGAQISLAQIYSAHRPPFLSDCGHAPLKSLYHIARRVRAVAGLKAEVF